jgi:hypothetical protein
MQWREKSNTPINPALHSSIMEIDGQRLHGSSRFLRIEPR